MDKEVLENHKNYLERLAFYRSFGYDLEKERELILDRAMPVSGKILEIGTGKGHFALCLAKRGHNFISVDISRQEQETALLNLKYFGFEKQAVFKIEDAERLSFPDQSFDVIFCVNVFHHLERPLVILDEMIRLLGPAGKAVLSDFTDKGLEVINACHEREGRKHDHFKHRLDKARDYFLSKGFKVNESQSEVQRMIIARAQ